MKTDTPGGHVTTRSELDIRQPQPRTPKMASKPPERGRGKERVAYRFQRESGLLTSGLQSLSL